MSTPKVAIILYTVREEAAKDLPGTLKRLRDIGFEYVQWSGMPSMTAEEARAALDDAGLKAMGAHCGVEAFEANFEKEVDYWKILGALDVAPGGMMGDCMEDLEAWMRGCRRLDALGARLKEEGMRLSYHNHDHEFTYFPGDDRYKLDILYEETDPSHLYAELDVTWVYVGGVDPAAYIRKYAGRCPLLHIKDVAGRRAADGSVTFKPVGQGALDWPEIFAAAREAEAEWLVYEQDLCEGSVFDAAQASFEFMMTHR